MKTNSIFFVLFLGIFLTVFRAYSSTEKPLVISSFSILDDLSKKIGGDSFQYESLVPANQDAHDYELKASQLKKLEEAKVIFVVGLGFEPWLERSIKTKKDIYSKIVNTSDGVSNLISIGDQKIDPHFWQDPELTKFLIQNIQKNLEKTRPQDSKKIKERSQELQHQLESINQEFLIKFKSLPSENRKFISGHRAYQYLARHFSLEILSIQGVSSHEGTSPRSLAEIQREVKSKGIHWGLWDSESERLMRSFAKSNKLQLIGPLTPDSLYTDPKTQQVFDFLSTYRRNLELLSNTN